MKTKIIAGEASWCFASDRVDAAITRCGGHLAPVKFRLRRKVVQPYSIAPWVGRTRDNSLPPLLAVLRGDFFCAPFGAGKGAYRGENHPPHGETANSPWTFQSLVKQQDRRTLHLWMETKIRRGRVDKFIQLRKGQTAVYCQHVLSGLTGKMSLGHHAMLKFSDKGESRLSTSPLRLGQVVPGIFEDPAHQGYSSLKPGAFFSDLRKVPTVFAKSADLSSYPARRGYDDLLMMSHRAADDFAWVAVTFPREGYVWFALKDPRILHSTVFWISNGGRHYPPWNSEHVNVMGVEDVTSYFHRGLKESSVANAWTRRGVPTALELKKDKPLVVNYVMGVAKIPGKFRRVKSIERGNNNITLISDQGLRTEALIDVSFLKNSSLL